MTVELISFTENGGRLAAALAAGLERSGHRAACTRKGERAEEWTAAAFRRAEALIFVGAAGIAAVLLAVWMKGVKAEYGIFVVIAAQLFFLFYGTGRLGEILDTVRQLEQYIKIRPVYLITLLKMTGITYSAEFASGICKDAGYASLGKQIEIFGKLTILAVSMPVLLALFGTLDQILT